MASAQVNITSNKGMQADAARALCQILDSLGIKHAIIGGFAVSILGSSRPTMDIDVLVDIDATRIRDTLRPQVSQINQQFAESGFKFYFAPALKDGVSGEQLLLASTGNVLVETLATSQLGLPLRIDPTMVVHGGVSEETFGLPTLHPSLLALTKIKRWAPISESTHPHAKGKAATDLRDIVFLIEWLDTRGLKIDIAAYNSANPERLYQSLRVFYNYLEQKHMTRELDSFRQVATASDLERIR